jgi:hypothetical protein
MKRYAIVAGLVLLGLVPARSARAQVTLGGVTFSGPASITVPENGATDYFYYTVDNESGATISVGLGPEIGFDLNSSGDPSDLPIVENIGTNLGSATCFSNLTNGNSCTIGFEIDTEDGAADGESATVANVFQVTWTGIPAVLLVNNSVTVTDPPASTPEPSSLLLFGTGIGLIGMATLVRRRMRVALARAPIQ